jgi:hypothetical protein
VQCENCLPGQYSCRCLPCPPGTFSNSSNSTTCQPCPPSQYSLPGSTVCDSCSTGDKLLFSKPPWGRWHAANWDVSLNMLKDTSGNKRHSVSSAGVYSGTETGNGATVTQTMLYGDINANIKLPAGSLPLVFTLCTMTRYRGTRRRIMNTFGGNFAHGHEQDNKRGVAYYGDTLKWVTGTSSVGNLDDWLVMCGKSSGQAPRNILVNGQAAGVVDTAITGNLQLAINAGQFGSSSDFSFAHAIVWDQVLSDEEMAIVSSIMMKSLTDSSVSIATMAVCSCTDSVVCTKPVWARWHAVNWDAANSRWRDSSGNSRHSILTEGTIQVATASGSGATAPQTYLYGNTASRLKFPLNMPTSFTLCTLAKYNGGARGRIFSCAGDNVLHGHWSGLRGVAHWLGWLTPVSSIAGDVADWLVFCGKNPGTAPNNILAHGTPRGVAATSYAASWQLSVNYDPYGETSDWAVSHAMVWDVSLTDAEMAQVSTTMLSSLSNSLVNIAEMGSTCGCSMPVPACGGFSNSSQTPCFKCAKCALGTYTSPVCSTGCLQCQYGTYSSLAGASACTHCPAGSYSMSPGASACLTCPAGKYGLYIGMTYCMDVSGKCMCFCKHIHVVCKQINQLQCHAFPLACLWALLVDHGTNYNCTCMNENH